MPKGVILAVQSLGPSTHLTGIFGELGVIFWMPSSTLVFVSICANLCLSVAKKALGPSLYVIILPIPSTSSEHNSPQP